MIPTLLSLVLYAFTATRSAANEYVLGTSTVLAQRSFSLENRYPVKSVSDVFRDNILLTLNYLDNKVVKRGNPDWAMVEKPQTYSFTLQPGEVFAFHEAVRSEYTGKVAKTTNAHFNWADGFKSDGWLTGDGVCHLASFIYWVALDAGLTTVAPTNHNFAAIPEVPKEYGVSIFDGDTRQNLYITNSLEKPVTFTFDFNGTNLDVKVTDAGI